MAPDYAADCWLCKVAYHHPDEPVIQILENEQAVVFLDKYPVHFGHTLIVPRRHIEHVVGDCSLQQYLDLQSLIYQVARAIQAEVQPERIYILSLGSQTGNRHVHWHILPHPAGTPYNEQELFDLRRCGRIPLRFTTKEMQALAARIKKRLA